RPARPTPGSMRERPTPATWRTPAHSTTTPVPARSAPPASAAPRRAPRARRSSCSWRLVCIAEILLAQLGDVPGLGQLEQGLVDRLAQLAPFLQADPVVLSLESMADDPLLAALGGVVEQHRRVVDDGVHLLRRQRHIGLVHRGKRPRLDLVIEEI